jgi:hypothetical protein
MNLQPISDASLSEDIILSFELKRDPPSQYHPLFYEGMVLNASPHNYNFHDFSNVDQKTIRSTLFSNFRQQIIELKNLPVGWDSYNADPPNYESLTNALKILDLLFELKFNPTRIMPSVEGGISFLFIRNMKYADIECDNDGDIFAGMSNRTGEPVLWQVKEQDGKKGLVATVSKISSFLDRNIGVDRIKIPGPYRHF